MSAWDALRKEGAYGHGHRFAAYSARRHARGALNARDHVATRQEYDPEFFVVTDLANARVVDRLLFVGLLLLLFIAGTAITAITVR